MTGCLGGGVRGPRVSGLFIIHFWSEFTPSRAVFLNTSRVLGLTVPRLPSGGGGETPNWTFALASAIIATLGGLLMWRVTRGRAGRGEKGSLVDLWPDGSTNPDQAKSELAFLGHVAPKSEHLVVGAILPVSFDTTVDRKDGYHPVSTTPPAGDPRPPRQGGPGGRGS